MDESLPRHSALARFAAATVVMAGLLGAHAGCSGPPPRAPNPTRPLDERRAIEIIIRAFHEENARPVPGRKIQLARSRVLQVDVGADARKFGVAYVAKTERDQLGTALPPKDPSKGDALQLLSGLGTDSDSRILILYDSEYVYDDDLGPEREATALTAERRLDRDVRDFLVRARVEHWP